MPVDPPLDDDRIAFGRGAIGALLASIHGQLNGSPPGHPVARLRGQAHRRNPPAVMDRVASGPWVRGADGHLGQWIHDNTHVHNGTLETHVATHGPRPARVSTWRTAALASQPPAAASTSSWCPPTIDGTTGPPACAILVLTVCPSVPPGILLSSLLLPPPASCCLPRSIQSVSSLPVPVPSLPSFSPPSLPNHLLLSSPTFFFTVRLLLYRLDLSNIHTRFSPKRPFRQHFLVRLLSLLRESTVPLTQHNNKTTTTR